MGVYTSKGLYKPTPGELNAGAAVNLNCDVIDTALSSIGQPSGIAQLDGTGVLVTAQIPGSIVSGASFRGVWNASTNSPTITSGSGTRGYYYIVSVAGTTSIDGTASWAVGDRIIFGNTVWQKVPDVAQTTGVFNDVITKSPVVDARAYNGAALNDTTIAAAQSANPNLAIALAPGTWTISNNLTLTGQIILRQGAILSIASGKVLTFTKQIQAGRYQIFTGSGTVAGLQTVFPEWWASNTTPGTTDMTTAIVTAYAACPSVILEGTYLVTSGFTLNQRFTYIGGLNNKWAKIVFNPASAGILFHFTGCPYQSGYYGAMDSTIANLILSSTNTVKKTGIQTEDGHNMLYENLVTDNVAWTSSTADCCGLNLCGRELQTIRKINILAEYPIRISPNTQFFTNTGLTPNIDCDMYHFQDVILTAGVMTTGYSSHKANVTVDPAAVIFNMTWDGYVSFNQGTGGFYHSNTNTTGSNSFNWTFKNVRFEQGDNNSSTMAITIKATTLYTGNVTIENLNVDASSQGFDISYVRGLNIKNFLTMTPTGLYAYKLASILSGIFESVHYLSVASVDNGTVKFPQAIPYSDGSYSGFILAALTIAGLTPAWQSPTLTNSWVASAPAPQFFLDPNGFVHLKGVVTNTNVITGEGVGGLFTLPVGYRPATLNTVPVSINNSMYLLNINPGTGYVALCTAPGSGAVTVTLDNIIFSLV